VGGPSIGSHACVERSANHEKKANTWHLQKKLSPMTLGSIGGNGLDLEAAAAGNTEVVRAKRKTMKALNLQDSIEDMLITLGKAYHLIRPLQSNDALFIYLVLDKGKANLAMARHQLRQLEKELVV
jgi:hypothetical protein